MTARTLVLGETLPDDDHDEPMGVPGKKGGGLDRATTMTEDDRDSPESVASQTPTPQDDQILQWVCAETWIDSETFPCELDVMVLSTPGATHILREREKGLDIGQALEPLFRDGLRPAKDGSLEFFQVMTSWLGGLSKNHAHDDLTLKAIQGFEDVLASATSIKERIGAANATLKAVQETAAKTNQKMIENYGSGPDERTYVGMRQTALTKWVTNRSKDLQTTLDTECSRRSELVMGFHDLLFHLMEKATQDYEDKLRAKLNGGEEELFHELDEELGLALGESQKLPDESPSNKPAEVDTENHTNKPAEVDHENQTTPKVVPTTMAFESMKSLLEEAIGKSGAHVDSQTKEALNKNLHKVFCDTFGATQPPSNSNDGGSPPQDEAH